MSINRRAFFKAAAAAPIAATFAVNGSAAAATVAAPTLGVAPAAFEYPWVWRLSLDGGETYIEDFDSREQALEYAASYEGAIVAECKSQDFDLRIDFDDLYSAMEGRNQDNIGEGEFIEPTREQEFELENAVNAVISAWAERHKINRTAWLFAGVRNEIKVSAPPVTALSADTPANRGEG